ncbi:Prefoldin subunit 3 [Phytophthora cinnamomi]|uniref:Prefoldin subunit 3 n=1 Tax=Phytophthora cinnamomi TaxID=4785 RepID=UPI00355A0F9D|nr:Prefoldin subunit 3 [Phytophthora cinnamomi]
MRVLVCKNDGCFELEPAELRRVESWSDVKMGLAHALYSEEDLFAVGSADDIALFTLPDGSPAEELEGQVDSLVEPDSRWVLDIFGSPFRQRSDLNLQTDHAIRGVRRVSATPFQPMEIRRASALHGIPSSGMPISPLGNAAHGFHEMSEEGYHEPYIHIGTWVPVMLKEKKAISLPLMKGSAAQYEDVLVTTNRAREYINNFRRAGRPVTILSIQTCTLPLAAACPSAISQQGPQILYEGVYHLDPDEMQRGFVQTVRLWFSFDCEQTISVTKVNGALGLKPLRQQDGWIVVQALPGSPCFEAGMRRDEVFLTHVNGVDVSPHSFPAVASNKAPAGTTSVREFNNIPARTRAQREAVCDKEQREKERLRARKEGFVRVDTTAAGSAMLVYTPQSQGFMSDADRFHSDTAGEERAAREDARTRAKIQQERRRQEAVNRDVRRWEAMDAASAEEKRRSEALRASGSKARRNKCGEPFNPVTLQYNDGKDGERLQAADAAIKHRAMLRAQNLQFHNSREGVNPITGESVRRIQTRDLLPPPQ